MSYSFKVDLGGIAFIIMLVTICAIAFLAVQKALGENYTYNMSESEIQDEWITQTCMKLSINSPECDEVYGGIMDRPSEGKLK